MKKLVLILGGILIILLICFIFAFIGIKNLIKEKTAFHEISKPEIVRKLKFDGEKEEIESKLIVKEGNLVIKVKDLDQGIKTLEKLANTFKGSIVLSQQRKFPKSKIKAKIVLRIPEEHFDKALQEIKSIAIEIISSEIKGEDITTEYIDLKARLKNLEAVENQLLEILKKAKTTQETLAVFRELKDIRNQIEILKGRIQFLERSSKFAKIIVNLIPEFPLKEKKWFPLITAKIALNSMIVFWKWVLDALIWLLIFFSPFILIGLIICLIIWFIKRRR